MENDVVECAEKVWTSIASVRQAGSNPIAACWRNEEEIDCPERRQHDRQH